jgi:hypothetical protein
MIQTIIGVILLLIPFLLIFKFQDKKIGFAYILSFTMLFHLVLAVITQFFHVFNYPVILIINILACVIILFYSDLGKLREKISKIQIPVIFLVVLAILFIQFYEVHYNYSGKITTSAESYKEVKSMYSPYPYFSDEWAAVSLIRYSIRTGSLPMVNPLWHDAPFPNLELPFHSFVGGIILLLGLDPLTQYSLLSIFTSILICSLAYLILRLHDAKKFSAAIAALSIPYIVNGANLAGLWTLIPVIMGIISMLLAILFISLNKKMMGIISSFLTLVFYLPLFLLVTASWIWLFISKGADKENIRHISYYLAICFGVFLILSSFVLAIKKDFAQYYSYILGKLIYPTFIRDAIPDYSIINVIPWPVLALAALGTALFFSKKLWLKLPILVGIGYWAFYSFSLYRFIIEYQRVVIATSVLIVILAGFGLQYLATYLKKIKMLHKFKAVTIAFYVILALFFVFSFTYTERDDWQKLKLNSVARNQSFSPASPANAYLQPDDSRIFRDIKNKNFISEPWKGTVIGVATDNYPLESKPSVLTNEILRYSEFMDADCKKKKELAKKFKIDYAYSQKFNCTGFAQKDISREGFVLYQVK